MVERLGDALSLPLRERNRLLELAGLAPSYPEGDLTTEDLAPFRHVIDRLLEAHEPFPGFVVDRHWSMVSMNHGTERFLSGTMERNTVRLLLGELRSRIENWPEVAGILLQRLSADLMRYPDDAELLELHAAVRSALGDSLAPLARSADRVICPRFRIGGEVVRTITVAARFESVADVTLDEVRVELVYPEDSEAERFFVDLSLAP